MSKYKYKLDITSIEYYSCEHTFISDEPLTPRQLGDIAEDAIHEENLHLNMCETQVAEVEVTELP